MDAAPTYAQNESLFLSSLEKSPLPTADLLALIRDIEVAETKSKSEEWTALLLETLTAANDAAGLYLVLKDRASQLASVLAPADIYSLLKKASKDRLFTAFLDSVGFGDLPLAESFRRLDLLTSLKPGTQVIDPSWGFGTVKRLDDFYKKITLDFSGKPGHTMTFATACESLARAPHDHLLTLSHTDHAGVMRMANERPDQLVRCALQSFGDMPVTRLEDLLARHKLVPASDWKRFWEAARKALKSDPLVIIPAKRADPIQLRAAAETYNAAWFEKLADTRDPLKILEAVAELEEAGKLPGLEDSLRGVLEDRLAFAAKGCHNTDSALYARLAITISRLGFLTPPVEQLRAHLWERLRYIEAADGLAVRDIAAMATFLLAEGGHSAPRMLEALPRMPFSLLNETLNLLKATPEAEESCRRLLMLPDAPPALINWIFRFRKDLVWRLPPLIELLKHAIALVEGKLSGEALRMQNNLKLLFEQRKWLETVFEELDGPQRQLFFERIQASTAWDPSTHRSLIGRMLKLDPALSERRISPSTQSHETVQVTSWRSLTERQLQYKKLIEVDLPKNSHDISVARSYGDLRENFEYQAAKDFQRQLLQRQSEMQLELKQIKGTDFSDAPCDKAGPGTTVTLRMPDGSCSTYTILGEWDRDETLNIISCKTRLALSLDGKAPGDEATIPMPGGETSVRIEAVAPLGEPIKAWIKAHPGEPA